MLVGTKCDYRDSKIAEGDMTCTTDEEWNQLVSERKLTKETSAVTSAKNDIEVDAALAIAVGMCK